MNESKNILVIGSDEEIISFAEQCRKSEIYLEEIKLAALTLVEILSK